MLLFIAFKPEKPVKVSRIRSIAINAIRMGLVFMVLVFMVYFIMVSKKQLLERLMISMVQILSKLTSPGYAVLVIQNLVEKNLDSIFSGLEFVETEFQIDDLRPDTIAFDSEKKSFVTTNISFYLLDFLFIVF